MIGTAGQMTEVEQIRKFVVAGNAKFTLRSLKTGTRFTYRVTKPAEEKENNWIRFVSVLTGPNNTCLGDYEYLGVITKAGVNYNYRQTHKSRIGLKAPSAIAFDYFARMVLVNQHLPSQLEFWHEGKCGRCGRPLTVPESISRGFGPECIGRM